jgi:hypothetical protein
MALNHFRVYIAFHAGMRSVPVEREAAAVVPAAAATVVKGDALTAVQGEFTDYIRLVREVLRDHPAAYDAVVEELDRRHAGAYYGKHPEKHVFGEIQRGAKEGGVRAHDESMGGDECSGIREGGVGLASGHDAGADFAERKPAGDSELGAAERKIDNGGGEDGTRSDGITRLFVYLDQRE